MATSLVEIANMALARVGSAAITSLDEADNEGATQANIFLLPSLDETLERAPWPEAMRRLRLTPYSGSDWSSATTYALGDVAAYGSVLYRSIAASNTGNQPDASPGDWIMLNDPRWGYAYPLPGDCIIPRRVGLKTSRQPGVAEDTPFDVRADFDADGNWTGKILLTDDSAADLEYTARIRNPAAFSASLVSAAAFRLAVELALTLRKDDAMALRMMGAWEAGCARAWIGSLSGVKPGPGPLAPHLLAR